jgi:hypothetical protein
MRIATSGLALAVIVAGAASAAQAQTSEGLNASEPASISQVVDGTKITVNYSRPRARGRTGLFGTEVRFGESWTPGANDATTITLSKDVSINGHPVPKGKYSVWIVVTPGDWNLMLDHDTTLFHMAHPKPRPGQITFMVPREHHAFTEVLTWSFPVVGTTGMTLTMQWDTVSVPLQIKVTPTYTTAVPPDAAKRVTGTYHWVWTPVFANPAPPPPPPSTAGSDTTGRPADPIVKNPAATFTVRYVGGELHATVVPPMFDDPAYGEYLLIQKKGDLYNFARIDRGELVEVWDFCALQFTPMNGQPASFEVRGTDDVLWSSGKATP